MQTTSKSPILTARNIVKQFGSAPVLQNASLDIYPGRAIAIMGPSGSGKSTLLHILSGILQPDSGEVLFSGRAIQALKEAERTALRRSSFGFVFQSGQLLPELPALENVALPLILGGAKVDAAKQQAAGYFSPLGLAGLENRRPGEMSGGQAQRVAIARALVTRPAVLFADEPTGALDAHTSHEVMTLLCEASRHTGAALVVVTHDPEVAHSCDSTVHVREGQLTAPIAKGETW
ncbi:ABC transporter ATP-binding protein [Hoyosella subflava]|uniref:Putative ABC transporter ATP-binding protein n=1 Tax=Hoyosella subflava (strain DSM 45089 / JCM 17490 / NBRC 109087 / DQS3-9A1) TaxID=443218 RepID=F6EEJ1_HOYSD|nr:ABC transporter ATP-binding protein [Hoyosella subflava]AEF39688.1 Putative ABC transporter ATP-binding protein [Hoyosella subflava DQS3-9A1]